jgi:hypothetical protein
MVFVKYRSEWIQPQAEAVEIPIPDDVMDKHFLAEV